MSLHLKHRPKEFKEVIGNPNLVASLQGMLEDRGSFPHSLLFHGPMGCGKTTLARIVAKELNCGERDLKEIDSAQFRGIDTARELRNSCQYKPIEGESRVYIIDECHKMTNDAQNAMLKVLEDTPKHAYFILCTTEPQKLIGTVRNRCSEFQVSTLSDKEMLRLIKRVSHKEGEKLEEEVIKQVIEDALGIPRTALQILKQVFSVTDEKRLEMARKAAEEQSEVIQLCRALIKNRGWREISKTLQGLRNQDPENVRRAVLGYMTNTILKTDNTNAHLVMEEFIEPFYNSGFPGLVFACYCVTNS
jgi:DNA polymerase III subunit gamma/tau